MSGAIFDRRGRTRLHHRYPPLARAGDASGVGITTAEPGDDAAAPGASSSTDEGREAGSTRQLWRNGGMLLGLLAIGWVIVEGAPMAWNRAALLRAQGQCMAYPGPEGLPVGRAPECWINYCALAGVADGSYDHVLFMHGLRSKGGTERLILVKEGPPRWINEGLYPPRPIWTSIAPVGWRGRPIGTQGVRRPVFTRKDSFARVQPSYEGDGVLHRPDESYFAGSIDPEDPSHFRIRYRVEGWEIRYSGRYQWFGGVGIIEGWLQDDGNVRMQFTETDSLPPPPDAPPGASAPPGPEIAPVATQRPTHPSPPGGPWRE